MGVTVNRVEVVGIESLLSKLGDIKELTLQKALQKGCQIVERQAKRNAPVDRGVLKASITHVVHDNYGVVGTNIKYAPYTEYGTGKYATAPYVGRQTPWVYCRADGKFITTEGNEAQPFLGPAVQQTKGAVYETMVKEINKELSKIAN